MERRSILKGAAGITAAGIGIAAFSGGAAAEIEDYDFSADELEGTSDDGTLDELAVWVDDGTFGYEGLQDPATEATIELQAVYDDETTTLDSTTRTDISGQSQHGLSFDRLEGDVLDHDDLSAEDFASDSDGETVTTDDVELQLAVTITTSGDSEVTGTASDTLTVIMNNLESTTGGDGTAGGEVISFETIAESDDGWVTLLAHFGETVTTFRIELDSDVYEDWPDNGDEYFQEVIVDTDADAEPTDEYRIGYHGPGGLDDTDITEGYIKINSGNSYESYHESEIAGYTATESEDQHAYEFELEHEGGDIPALPDELGLEGWGLDGGEGIQTTDVDVSTGTAWYRPA